MKRLLMVLIVLLALPAAYAFNFASLSVNANSLGSGTYHFTCSANDFTPATYSWSFGDGTTQVLSSPTVDHTYAASGIYAVTCATQLASMQLNATGLLNVSLPPTPACQGSMTQIPAVCTGGTVVQDSVSGTCRTIVCTNGANSIKVFACDKPDRGAKTYFEMYRQSYSGTPPKVCLGTTCVQNNGYAKSPNFCMNLLASGANGWQTFQPGWSYNDGIYASSNTGADIPVESVWGAGYDWTSLNVRTDVNIQSAYTPSDVQLIFRYKNTTTWGSCRIMQDLSETRLEILDTQQGVLNATPFPAALGTWYTLNTTIQGNDVICEVVGGPKITAKYTTLSSGTVGLRATHIPAWFRNVLVRFG